MPAFTNRSVGSWAGINEELVTIVWPRSSKNLRNRRRISLLFMKGVYFLSNGVLIVSKTKQSSKKTSGIAGSERHTQFPILHFSCECILQWGPFGLRQDFVGDSR